MQCLKNGLLFNISDGSVSSINFKTSEKAKKFFGYY